MVLKKNFQESKLNKSCFCLQLFPFKMIFLLACCCFFPLCNQDSSKKIYTQIPQPCCSYDLGAMKRLPPLGCPEPLGNAPRIKRSGLNQWSWDSGDGSKENTEHRSPKMVCFSSNCSTDFRSVIWKEETSQNSQIMSWWRNPATCEVASKFKLNYI